MAHWWSSVEGHVLRGMRGHVVEARAKGRHLASVWLTQNHDITTSITVKPGTSLARAIYNVRRLILHIIHDLLLLLCRLMEQSKKRRSLSMPMCITTRPLPTQVDYGQTVTSKSYALQLWWPRWLQKARQRCQMYSRPILSMGRSGRGSASG